MENSAERNVHFIDLDQQNDTFYKYRAITTAFSRFPSAVG